MATMHRFSVDTLMEATRRLIEGMGTPPAIAEVVAEILVDANAAGHDSHGIIRIPAYYRQLEGGSLLPAAEPSVVRDTVATAVVDGGRGWGHYATRWCMDLAMAKAREAGIGAVTLLRSNHIGRLGAFVERAAGAGCIGLVTTGSGARNSGCAFPPGGTERVLGTNPMAFGVPTGDGPPFVIDFATTVVAEGKIQVARSKGAPLPPNCILDKQGRPSIQPSDFYDGGSLLYAGGHKGYGLSLLTALLSGLSGAYSVEPWRMGGVFVQAIDVSAFQAPEEYRAAAAALLNGVKSVGRAEGVDEILVPGEPEQRSRADRLSHGVEIPDTVWSQVLACAEKLGVAMPAADG
jgi:LDH2 family malate/lactate/ureidoglycolate dehydrogenase